MCLAYSKIIIYNKAKHYYTELLSIIGVGRCLEMGGGRAILALVSQVLPKGDFYYE